MNAPGQFIYEREEKQHLQTTSTSSPIQFWIGDSDALQVYWCADVDITAVIYISSQINNIPQHAAWLRKESIKQTKTGFSNPNPSRGFAAKKPSGLVAFLTLQVSDLPEDASNQDNWEGLEAVVPQAFEFVKEIVEVSAL
ncbi:hypothetical protein EON65_42125 [archaeon]|nr:MAG: hypothetical protein EON65_42125 [archaeon]